MPTTPERIRVYLSSRPHATAGELSCALDMTIQNIRHTLDGLVRDGWVEVCGEQKPEGRGRRAVLYRLNPSLEPNNLAFLVGALLSSLRTDLEPPVQDAILRNVAGMIARPMGDIPKKPVARLNKTIERLNQFNYHARWEAGPDGPQIILSHRPYGPLTERYPELEILDQYVIEALLGIPVQSIPATLGGGTKLLYRILLVKPGSG